MTTAQKPDALPVVAWLITWNKDRVRGSGSLLSREVPQPKYDCNQYDPLVRQSDHEAALLAKEAECEALRVKAARYDWLRECDWFGSELCVLRDPKRVLTQGMGLGADCPSRDRLDTAIDAARAAAEQGGAS